MSRYAAVVLAAGRGTRFRATGGTAPSKLVAAFAGAPLVRHAVEAALASQAEPVVVVTGHARQAIESALWGLPVTLAHNPHYATGLAGSLKAGIAALPTDAEGAVILLGDMPMVAATLIDRILAAAAATPAADAVVPVVTGRRGNPVFLSRTLFAAVAALEGDAGARHLLLDPALKVGEVAMEDDAAALDIDEAADLERLQSSRPLPEGEPMPETGDPTSRMERP